ncbi:gamma-glutamyl-gamma-aminobutyrate hydrolase family protein, partial [Rhizobium ruizarguesonis]
FRVAARAPDGTIEAFEGDTDGFCLGIQWHPEYRLSELDRNIMRAFVDRSAKAAVRKARSASSAGSNGVRERLAQLELALPEASSPPGAFSG